MTQPATPDQSVHIRTTNPDELPRLHELDREIFGDLTYPYFVLRQLFDLYYTNWLVAAGPSELIGYSLCAPTLDGGSAWVLGLGVRARYRRAGYGRRLLSASLGLLEDLGAKEVRLAVVPENAAAIGLYESLGFRMDGLHDDYFGAGEDRAIMAMSL